MTTVESRFLKVRLTRDTQDSYFIRTSIVRALTNALPDFYGTLLDVGSGEQPYRSLLTSPPSRVTRYLAMDLAQTIPGAYAATSPDISWDGASIPLSGGSIDSAMATEVLEHSSQPLTVLTEMHRVLRPRGFLFITVPFLWPLHDVPYDQYRYTPFAMERLLDQSGFVDIDITPSGGWDASLAQMLGLWAVRRPMRPQLQTLVRSVTLPIVRRLLKSDRIPDVRTSPMIPGLIATARKG